MKIDNLKKQLEQSKKIQQEYLAGWKKARADFLNYKKEEEKRINELIKYSNEKLILKILLILDDLEIAEKKMPEDLGNNQWIKGLLQVKNQILDFLKGQEIEEIKAKGRKFDPNFHEAVEIAGKKQSEPDIVIEEIKKGYLSQGKVLRPTRVKISK